MIRYIDTRITQDNPDDNPNSCQNNPGDRQDNSDDNNPDDRQDNPDDNNPDDRKYLLTIFLLTIY
jgi:hypothetical protein